MSCPYCWAISRISVQRFAVSCRHSMRYWRWCSCCDTMQRQLKESCCRVTCRDASSIQAGFDSGRSQCISRGLPTRTGSSCITMAISSGLLETRLRDGVSTKRRWQLKQRRGRRSIDCTSPQAFLPGKRRGRSLDAVDVIVVPPGDAEQLALYNPEAGCWHFVPRVETV